MHRIHTTLDVALGCTEEVLDICGDNGGPDEIRRSATIATGALRLIYHYTSELTDLASLGWKSGEEASRRSQLPGPAARCGGQAGPGGEGCIRQPGGDGGRRCARHISKPRLVQRVLTNLVLGTIIAPNVTQIQCSVRRCMEDGVPHARFCIADNGRGEDLQERADSIAVPEVPGSEIEHSSADIAGFGVVRRLAKSLGGRVELECEPGKGTRTLFMVPLRGPER